jgi:hypothetical protein
MVSDTRFSISTMMKSSFQGLDDLHPMSNGCESLMIMIFMIRILRIQVLYQMGGRYENARQGGVGL